MGQKANPLAFHLRGLICQLISPFDSPLATPARIHRLALEARHVRWTSFVGLQRPLGRVQGRPRPHRQLPPDRTTQDRERPLRDPGFPARGSSNLSSIGISLGRLAETFAYRLEQKIFSQAGTIVDGPKIIVRN